MQSTTVKLCTTFIHTYMYIDTCTYVWCMYICKCYIHTVPWCTYACTLHVYTVCIVLLNWVIQYACMYLYMYDMKIVDIVSCLCNGQRIQKGTLYTYVKMFDIVSCLHRKQVSIYIKNCYIVFCERLHDSLLNTQTKTIFPQRTVF